MCLASVKFQRSAQARLQAALRSRRATHAYVFHGPEGVGKEMLARGFARVLLCASPQERSAVPHSSEAELCGRNGTYTDACGRCDDCALAAADAHPDFHLIYRELIRYHPNAQVRKRKALELGVDVVREFLTGTAGNRPVRGRAKVYVVREAERMNIPAQNALLKTLEEPPPDTYVILVTSSADRLLSTTRSRCQLVPFGPLPTEFIRERLMEADPGLSREQAHFLAAVSEGRLGPALAASGDGLHHLKQHLVSETAELEPGKASAWARSVEQAAQTLAESISARRSDASEADLKRQALETLLSVISYTFDDALRARTGAGHAPVHSDQQDLVRRIADRLGQVAAAAAIRSVAAAQTYLNRNVNVALSLEGLAAELISLMNPPPAAAPPR
jgi:DNA polymerase-3 subunit delta'